MTYAGSGSYSCGRSAIREPGAPTSGSLGWDIECHPTTHELGGEFDDRIRRARSAVRSCERLVSLLGWVLKARRSLPLDRDS